MQHGSLGLAIPVFEQKPLSDKLDPMETYEWSLSLPLANVSHTAKKLFYRLHGSQTEAADPLTRFEVLETLVKVVNTTCRLLEDRFLHDVGLSPEQRRDIASLAQSLQSEMWMGYKTVLEGFIQDSTTERDHIICAALRAMWLAHQIMMRSHQFYAPPPKGMWQELHLIYEFADINNLKEKVISSPKLLLQATPYRTIDDAYKHSVLFSLTNPYRLSHVEMAQLDLAILSWLDDFKIMEVDMAPDSLYGLDLTKDIGPLYMKFLAEREDKHKRAIHLTPLLNRLEDVIARSEQTKKQSFRAQGVLPELGISKVTLVRILESWKTFYSRAHERTETDELCSVTHGLTNTHAYLMSQRSLTPIVHKEHATFVAIPRGSEDPLHGACAIDFGQDLNVTVTSSPNLVLDCVVLNVSDGGACLQFTDSRMGRMQAGDIVGFSNVEGEWKIGTLQWVNQTTEKQYQFGLQFMGGQAEPIMCRLLNESFEPQSDFARAILLTRNDGVRTVILPLIPFRENSKVQMIDEEGEHTIKLAEKVSASGYFNQFSITRATPTAEKKLRIYLDDDAEDFEARLGALDE